MSAITRKSWKEKPSCGFARPRGAQTRRQPCARTVDFVVDAYERRRRRRLSKQSSEIDGEIDADLLVTRLNDKPVKLVQCIEDGCTSNAQTGGAGGKRYGKCYQRRKNAQVNDRLSDPKKRKKGTCANDGCTGETVIGWQYGKFCEDCYKSPKAGGTGRKKAKKQ